MKVKEESEKISLKLIQKTKIMASGPITSWQIDGLTVETVSDFMFLGSKITTDGDCSHEIKRRLLLGRKVMTNLGQFSCSVLSDSATPWITARQASLSITNSRSSLRLTSIESMMPSNHLILCCTLLLLPSVFPSFRVFSSESTLHIRWPKYWSLSFSISEYSKEYSGFILLGLTGLISLLSEGLSRFGVINQHCSDTNFYTYNFFSLNVIGS